MKSKLVVILVILLLGTVKFSYAQKERTRIYRVWVEFKENERKLLGTLIKLQDTAIVVQYWEEEKVEEIPVSQIEKIKFRRKGGVGKGAAIGGGIGIVVGLISGYADGDDTPEPDVWFDFSATAEEKAAGSAIVLGTIGAISGSIVGSLKKKFIIRGEQDNYEAVKNELIKYLAENPESI